MRIRVKKLLLLYVMALPLGLMGQTSSINTFSPYTFYGLGDLSSQGTSAMRSMGGVGTAYHSTLRNNSLNPASVGSVARKTFLLNYGMEGANFYLKSRDGGMNRKTSYNTFNISDFSMTFPLAQGVGMSLSMRPFSSVGYRMAITEEDPRIVADLGDVKYMYSGNGGLAQFGGTLGFRPINKLGLGIEAVYYLGNIERTFSVDIVPVTTSQSFANLTAYENINVSRAFVKFGGIYDIIGKADRVLTVGATFQPKGRLNVTNRRFIPTTGIVGDTISFSSVKSDFRMPSMLNAGIFYQNGRIAAGADYSFAGWAQSTSGTEGGVAKFVDTHTVSAGVQYIPNPGDVRSYFNRISYRAGIRTGNYYMTMRGKKITDKAVTAGLGFPVKMVGLTYVNVGVELGTRGSMAPGMVRDHYFKFTVGINFFGEDYWFQKLRIN